jgi:hypothetical protein
MREGNNSAKGHPFWCFLKSVLPEGVHLLRTHNIPSTAGQSTFINQKQHRGSHICKLTQHSLRLSFRPLWDKRFVNTALNTHRTLHYRIASHLTRVAHAANYKIASHLTLVAHAARTPAAADTLAVFCAAVQHSLHAVLLCVYLPVCRVGCAKRVYN